MDAQRHRTPTRNYSDLTQLSAAQLAQHIARRDVSAVEAVEAHIARIAQVNPSLNALVVERFAAARAEARRADEQVQAGADLGPLHGVPVTVKESLDLAGAPSTFGLPSRAGINAKRDEVHVARLRQAGAIVLGKTNVAQMLFYYESDNPLYGRTNNPWNLARTAGGSSGGEAALIATGGSALGLATDIAGSVRVPANFCGVAGLKPTAGRTPDPGRFSSPIGQRTITSQVGVIARSAEDVALGLSVINGGANPPVEPPMPLGDHHSVDVAGLRLAWYTDDGTFTPSPAVARAVREAAEALRGCGAAVTQWHPPQVSHALDLLYGIFGADGLQLMRRMIGGDKRAPQVAQLMTVASLPHGVIENAVRLLTSIGQPGTAATIRAFGYRDTAHYWQLVEEVLDYREHFAAALDQDDGGPFDVILCPVNPLPAFTHGATKELITAGAYAGLYNVLGYPAGVTPWTRVRPDEETVRAPSRDTVEKVARRVEEGSAGLPVGVQVVARPWREHVALAVMAALEQAACGREVRPQTPIAVVAAPPHYYCAGADCDPVSTLCL